MRWLSDGRLPIVGLVVLFVVTVVLIAVALRPVDAPAGEGPAYTPPPTVEPSAPESPEPDGEEPSPEPTEDPTEEATAPAVDPSPVPAQRVLTAASADRAWRASVGDCDEPGVLEVTGDGGQSWETVDPALAPVVRLKALDESTMFAIGGGPDCAASFRITGSAGAEWETANDELAGTWFLEPADRNVVHGPGGEASPCEADVVDLAGLSIADAAVLCTDGTVQETTDAGQSWTGVGTLPGGVAIAPQLGADAEVEGYLFASLEDGCDGVAVRQVGQAGDGLDAAAAGCAAVGEVAGDQVAIAVNGAVAWLWAGDQVLVSADAGSTW